ncbi:hypothetical protein ACTFIV_000572 [Dictyostelium citrinum]
MVIMDHNTNISGSPTSSQVLSNGIQSIQSGISSGVQSIQSLPPQMYILKERIVNKNSYHIMDDNNVNSNNNNNNNNIVGLKDYGDGGIYCFQDDKNRSASPSRLRSLSAPGSTSTTTAPATCTGTKNQRELFQQSIDSLAAKFNSNNNNSNINNNNSLNNNHINSYINNINSKDINNSNNKSSLKNSGGSGSCGSDSEQLNSRIRDSTDEMYESEELTNIDDEMIRMRSLSLTSLETFKKIEREKNIYSPSSTRDDVLSPYEMMSHLEYQERLEREEMERMDKNNVIISQSSSEGYTGNQVQCESTSSNSIKSSSSLNMSTSIPRISVSSSNSFSGTPSASCSISPPKSSSPNSNSLTGSLNGTSVLLQQHQQNGNPITSITNSPSTRASPLFKRSLTSNTTLSKSSTKLPSFEKDQQQAPSSPQMQQQAQQLPPQLHAQLEAQIQQQQQQLNNPKKGQQLVKSLSSQTILKEQPIKSKQSIAAVSTSSSSSSTSLSPNRPSTPIQMSSSPNLNPLKKLSNKLSLSTHSLPQSPPQTSSNTPTLTPKNKLVKCPSGNSILPSKKSISQSQQSQPVNNSFQLELKQHLKMKREQNINNNNNYNDNNNNSIDNNYIKKNEIQNNNNNTNNNNVIIENIHNNSNNLSRKERFELKKQNIPKPMDEPKGTQVESIIKITFQFPSTGKKVNRYFNADCKVEELKNYIEWFAYQEPQLFDSSFKLSDDSHLKIVDYNIEYTILPTKFVISNFDVTFKDSGFVPKSNIINISLV